MYSGFNLLTDGYGPLERYFWIWQPIEDKERLFLTPQPFGRALKNYPVSFTK